MTERQKDFVVELVAGAILLALGAFILGTDWSNWKKGLGVTATTLLVVLAVLALAPVGRRVRNWLVKHSKPAVSKAAPTLIQQLDETWFVTFTSGPYACGEPPRDQHVTAIAAVGRVDGDQVELTWRDKGTFPARVPIKLLDATHIHRYRVDARGQRRVRVRNEGLHSPGPGGVVTATGWRAHQWAPHQIAFARFADLLTEEDREAMEADADLATYDLGAL